MGGRGGAVGVEADRLDGVALGVVGLSDVAVTISHAPGEAIRAVEVEGQLRVAVVAGFHHGSRAIKEVVECIADNLILGSSC